MEIEKAAGVARRGAYVRRSPELKAAIVAQCLVPGASVAAVALAHGVNANLVRKWIEKSRPSTQAEADHWEHQIKVEKRHPPDPILSASALCLTGANAAPPEDVGGAPGSADFLEAILDREHPEHHAMREWCGENFEPGRFDVSLVDERLERLKV